MRQVTKTVVAAFLNHEKKCVGNTSTDGQTLFLHGNAIARFNQGKLEVTDAGWPTVTTRERLNGLPNVRVNQSKGVQYLNGKQWDGAWTAI